MGNNNCAKCTGKQKESDYVYPDDSGSKRTARVSISEAPTPRRETGASRQSNFSTNSRHVERSALIGAFKVRRFDQAKMRDVETVNVLVQIIRCYDVLFLQEIVDSTGNAVEALVAEVNGAGGEEYSWIVSPRLGRGRSKEQYAFLFRPSRFQLKKSGVYEDHDNVFAREPFVVQFRTHCVKDAKEVTFVGVHTQAKNAATEIDALHDVIDWTKAAFRTTKIFILGDLNAGGSYVSASDWSRIRTRTSAKYHWLIPDWLDTTATNSSVAYDRIIAYGKAADLIEKGSAATFRYDAQFSIPGSLMLRVSDHYPVQVSLEPLVHQDHVDKYVTVKSGFQMEDLRYHQEDLKKLITSHGGRLKAAGFVTKLFWQDRYLAYAEIVGQFVNIHEAISAMSMVCDEVSNTLVSNSLLSRLRESLGRVSAQCDVSSITVRIRSYPLEKRCFVCVDYDSAIFRHR